MGETLISIIDEPDALSHTLWGLATSCGLQAALCYWGDLPLGAAAAVPRVIQEDVCRTTSPLWMIH